MVRCGEFWQAWCVVVCPGRLGIGLFRQAGQGKVGSVEVGFGGVRFVVAGEASRVMGRLGTFRYGSAGKARRCAVS